MDKYLLRASAPPLLPSSVALEERHPHDAGQVRRHLAEEAEARLAHLERAFLGEAQHWDEAAVVAEEARAVVGDHGGPIGGGARAVS